MQESIRATTRDALYGWTAERLARKQAALGAPSYLYLFDHGYPAADDAGLHAFHASELPFVFGTIGSHAAVLAEDPGDAAGDGALRRDDRLLDELRADRAADGDGAPDWPAYGRAART